MLPHGNLILHVILDLQLHISLIGRKILIYLSIIHLVIIIGYEYHWRSLQLSESLYKLLWKKALDFFSE